MRKFLLSLLLLLPIVCFAQEATKVLHLNNGNVVYGEIVSESATSVTFKKINGEIQIFQKVEILKITDGDGMMRIPSVRGKAYVDYTIKERGFWGAVELSAGVNVHIVEKYKSSFPLEATFIGGYRVNEYFQIGVGAGVRQYVGGNDRIFVGKNNEYDHRIKVAFPLFANIRGLFIDNRSRTVLPYWSANIGYTIYDGFYLSPSAGLRIGSMERNHFTMGIGYSLQSVKGLNMPKDSIGRPGEAVTPTVQNKILHAVVLKCGYQF